jgi:hypothetical protein
MGYVIVVSSEADIYSSVDVRGPDDCWPWVGKLTTHNHANVRFAPDGGKPVGMTAHRALWMLTHAEPLVNQHVVHSCTSIDCLNPAHLALKQQGGDPEVRFWTHVVKAGPDECWFWTGGMWSCYGRIYIGGRYVFPHRYAYELDKGPIPAGLVIDHTCRQPICVNPRHLEAVSDTENKRRGEGAPSKNAKKQICKHNHPLVGNNVKFDEKGRRICLACRRTRTRNYKAESGTPARPLWKYLPIPVPATGPVIIDLSLQRALERYTQRGTEGQCWVWRGPFAEGRPRLHTKYAGAHVAYPHVSGMKRL